MVNWVILLVGAPGAGKTTLARSFLGNDLTYKDEPMLTFSEKLCAAGHYKGDKFDGSDKLRAEGHYLNTVRYWCLAKSDKYPTMLLDGIHYYESEKLAYVKRLGREVQKNLKLVGVYLDIEPSKLYSNKLHRGKTTKTPKETKKQVKEYNKKYNKLKKTLDFAIEVDANKDFDTVRGQVIDQLNEIGCRI